ncbi:MAG: hypothetical protein HQ559_03460 [Lentisphaerae bacterium]|nr:hypothetical protein [Lentisphaerota bacterium]
MIDSPVLNRMALIGAVVFSICGLLFVASHDEVVLNRFADSWWHVAAADEYSETGVFAKDPFFENVPPFAQFGFVEFLNAKISSWTGLETGRVFPFLVAVNAGLFLCAAFLAGCRLGGNAVAGCVSAVSWAFVYPGHTFIGLGFPFNTSVSLFALFFVSCGPWLRTKPPTMLGMLWRGAFLGIIFDLHVFVGLAGGVVAAVWFLSLLAGLLRGGREGATGLPLRRVVVRWLFWGGAFAVPFLLLTFRWILLHVSLRAFLDVSNAHENTAYPIEWSHVLVLGGGMAVLLLVMFLRRSVAPETPKDAGPAGAGSALPSPRLLPVLVLGVVLLIFCLPPFNGFIREHTSWYMAKRIPWLFPVGPVLGLGVVGVLRTGQRSRMSVLAKLSIVALALAMVLPAAKTWLLLQAYLVRQHDYDEHVFGYLQREFPDRAEWRGRTVLADPNTSYLLRGMLKTRVLTVIPGEASPAVDYAPRHALVKDALLRGPVALGTHKVDAAVLDVRNGATRNFAGRPVENIKDTWTSQGWVVERESDEFVLLVPPTRVGTDRGRSENGTEE